MARNLSKSRFQKGLQCERALWLGIHRPELRSQVTESQQWIFDQGHQVGLLARQLFPDGVEVSEDHEHSADALVTTARLLASGVEILYEPAFEYRGTFARVDILVASGDGRWDMYEVKSGTALKDVYVTDAAVQAYTLEGAGLKLRSVNVVRIDTSYVYAGGEYDPHRLFAIEDVTDMAREYLPTVGPSVERLQAMLEGSEPQVIIGNRCSHPYPCEFSAYCHAFLPAQYPVTTLPRLTEPVLHALLHAGHTCILDVPDDFPGLTLAQRESISAARAGAPRVDATGLASALGKLEWPVYHLDFETISPALPLWPGTRPYQAVPFQYSLHIQHADGTVEHRGYLHTGKSDPRRVLARHLIADLGETGSIVHYTAYERTQIDGLMNALPELGLQLRVLRSRLFDLEPVIRNNTRHPKASGRSSIKYVLPAWCPDLSYAAMGIGDGQTASARYLRILTGQANRRETRQTLADLEAYCSLDTLAMVRLLDRMLEFVPAEPPTAVDDIGLASGA